MTPAAVFERLIAAKRPFAIVASQTRHAPRGDEMLGGRRRADLPRLSRACGEPVTVSTCKPLARVVVCMTECVTIRARVGAGGPVSLLLVTDAARSHLAS